LLYRYEEAPIDLTADEALTDIQVLQQVVDESCTPLSPVAPPYSPLTPPPRYSYVDTMVIITYVAVSNRLEDIIQSIQLQEDTFTIDIRCSHLISMVNVSSCS